MTARAKPAAGEAPRPAAIVWFRQDLRLEDNPALAAAARSGAAVVPVYIWSPEEEGAWPPGAASRWWLHQSLRSLGESLAKLGSPLIIRRGPSLEAIEKLATETGARAVYWNRRYEPAAIARDSKIKEKLRAAGFEAESFNSALLFEPHELRTKLGEPFKIFTPFWRAMQEKDDPPPPAGKPRTIAGPEPPRQLPPESLAVGDLALEPRIDWAGGIREAWSPGERGASRALAKFFAGAAAEYTVGRDRPGREGVSRLSPHLHFGEISPRQVWNAATEWQRESGTAASAREAMAYKRQLAWRDFAHHLLYHFPKTPEAPMRPEFEAFPWRRDRRALRAWQRGATGFPIVDAGMRELWTTGWMHNRVRMIVASFLVKDLMIPWQEGARWFWDTLVDADLANNTLGWQWTAGCGVDASPFFRVFNPALQAQKFDPDGEYIRGWVPECGEMNYPPPIVDHNEARDRALEAFAKIKNANRR